MHEEYETPGMREQLASFIGCRVLDVSENDEGEDAFLMLLFEDGNYLKFPIGEAGFEATEDGEGGEDEDEEL
jgi:hypothetical protein